MEKEAFETKKLPKCREENCGIEIEEFKINPPKAGTGSKVQMKYSHISNKKRQAKHRSKNVEPSQEIEELNEKLREELEEENRKL